MTPSEFCQLLQDIQQAPRERMDKAYQVWLEKLATLSTTALALLVSLQKTYVQPGQQDGWLLSACWISLCSATLCAAWALYGESRSHQEFLILARDTLLPLLPKYEQMDRSDLVRLVQAIPYKRPKRFQAAAGISAASFAAAVVALTAYAVLNLR